MNLAKLSILLAAVWCTFCLGVSLIAGAVVLLCVSPDIPQCGDSGVEVARLWRTAAPFAIVAFGAGAFFGFRTLAGDIKTSVRALVQRLNKLGGRG